MQELFVVRGILFGKQAYKKHRMKSPFYFRLHNSYWYSF